LRRLDAHGGHHVFGFDAEIDLRDSVLVRRALERAEPDVIFHLGGISGPMVHADDPSRVTAVNTLGTVNVMEAARGLPNRPTVILASSVAAIELSSTAPRSIYASTKRFIEEAGDYFTAQDLPVIVVRVGSLYGPGRTTDHIITQLTHSIATTATAHYDSGAVEPLVHISDAARFLVGIGASGRRSPNPYHLVQELVSHAELARIIGNSLGVNFAAHPTSGQRLTWSERLDSLPLQRDAGLTFEVGIEAGVAEWARRLTA
jgi:nucleoside-diphosphate-sugar epimerase